MYSAKDVNVMLHMARSDKIEKWKQIKGYPDYEVSRSGKIKSLKFGKEKILKPRKGKDGYLYVDLCKNGKVKTHRVHKLVANAFLENPENKPCVDHINGIITDNRVENLRFATHQENGYNRKSKRGSTSKYKGVSFDKQRKKWRARYQNADGKYVHIGYFDTELEAHEAYVEKVKELHGEFLNVKGVK